MEAQNTTTEKAQAYDVSQEADMQSYINQHSQTKTSFMSAKNFTLGSLFSFEVLEYEGLKHKKFPDGKETDAPTFKVKMLKAKGEGDYAVKEGNTYELSLNLTQTRFLFGKGITSFKDAVGKKITGTTIQTTKGRGFSFVEVE